jgi:hypothetical protein
MSTIKHLSVCATIVFLGLGRCSITRAQAPTDEQVATQTIDSMHKELGKLGREIGGLTDDEWTKIDTWEAQLDQKIKADPGKTQGREFEQSSMKEYRALLNADHQKKFDEAMARSQKIAQRIVSSISLKNVGVAGMLWSTDHNGNFAPDLGSLAAAEHMSANVFLAGGSKTRIPDDWETMVAKAKADWTNKNSDFVYLGAGQKTAGDSGFVVAYIKPELATDGNQFLMGDGSVQTKTADQSKAIVADL